MKVCLITLIRRLPAITTLLNTVIARIAAGFSSAFLRALTVFNRVVMAGKRLMSVIMRNEGLSNKDLAKFETQIQNLADKWDR